MKVRSYDYWKYTYIHYIFNFTKNTLYVGPEGYAGAGGAQLDHFESFSTDLQEGNDDLRQLKAGGLHLNMGSVLSCHGSIEATSTEADGVSYAEASRMAFPSGLSKTLEVAPASGLCPVSEAVPATSGLCRPLEPDLDESGRAADICIRTCGLKGMRIENPVNFSLMWCNWPG